LVSFFLTSGISLVRQRERQMFRSPKVKKGRVKPPTLYSKEPTAGPTVRDEGVFSF